MQTIDSRLARLLQTTSYPDMKRVHRAATDGPADLRAFLAALGRRLT